MVKVKRGSDKQKADNGCVPGTGTKRKKGIDQYLLLCIAVCAVVSFLSFIYFIVKGNGAFTLRDDFNTQQLTFNNQVNGFLKNSFPGEWCWNIDTGASFVNSFAFYILGSPFAWLSFLFPREAFPFVVGWIYMLKYVVAGVTSYLYLKTMTGKGGYCEVIGAVAYAFSGFSACALEFYHFHDVVALFPLLLFGMEKLMKGRGVWIFSLSVFLNCLVNYYFFIGEVFFIILYYVFRFAGKRGEFLKGMLKCLAGGVLGVGMACVLFLPSMLYNMSNPRAGDHLSASEYLLPDLTQILYILKGILLPGDIMPDQAALLRTYWSSTACWIPMFGCSAVIAYILKKRDWLAGIMITLTIVSFSPFLSSAFILFTQDYQRWWYMLVLMGALATTLVLKEIEAYPVKTGIILNVVLLALFYAALRYLEGKGEEPQQVIFHPMRLKLYLLIAGGGLFLFLLISAAAKGRGRYLLLLTGICASAFVSTFYAIHDYRDNKEDTKTVLGYFDVASHLQVPDPQYRYRFEYWDNWFSLAGDAPGLGSFISTCSNSRYEFQDLFEYYHPVRSMNKGSITGVRELLGGSYELRNSNGIEKGEKLAYEFYAGNGHWCVIENPACPIGFKTDKYILRDDLMYIRKKNRGIALLYAAVVDEKDEALVSGSAGKVTYEDIDFKAELLPRIKQTQEQCVTDFVRSSRGLTCVSDFDSDSLIYFSVPYDPGWEISIDGQPAEPIDSGGFILLNVQAGRHNIDFTYHTPALRTGLMISILSFLLTAILAAASRGASAGRRDKKNSK